MDALHHVLLGGTCVLAFLVRLFSGLRYEWVVHEFDPYFNYRASKFLIENGFRAFSNFFDTQVWYPLGRLVGATVYPGLMWVTALFYYAMHWIALPITVTQACVFLSPLFAVFATIVTYMMTVEVKDKRAGLIAAAFVAIVPGYISRSVAGAYDNECISITTLLLVFYFWIKAVKSGSMFWAAACAGAYFLMAAAWGGYVYLINVIPLYTLVMLFLGRWSQRLYVAYSTFYVIGILFSMQIPFIGFMPVQSGEHAIAFAVFALVQAYTLFRFFSSILDRALFQRILRVGSLTLLGLGAAAYVILSTTGYITPWTGRFYNLLDPTYAKEHIPIIASVSEHQPTTWASFFFDLHLNSFLFVAGVYFCFRDVRENLPSRVRENDGLVFLLLYALTSVYFAGVMVRLMLVLAPIACIMGAIALSTLLSKFVAHAKFGTPLRKGEGRQGTPTRRGRNELVQLWDEKIEPAVPWIVVFLLAMLMMFYSKHCIWVTSEAYSSPSIVLAARQPDGSKRIFDDFREAYSWLAHNTPPEARVMSWWDYGYQITAMANRTVIVDNNTWNNSHIATVGTAMASREEDAYPILRQLDVDYILVVFGGLTGYASDDINKFLWMVRIGGGVFPRIKEKDYLTSHGEFKIDRQGTPAMLNSLMYKMCYYRFGEVYTAHEKPTGWDNVRNCEIGKKDISFTYLDEAFTSEHWIVRIYKVREPDNF